MSQIAAYSSPGAFRRALTDRLRSKATSSKWNLYQLQRQIAYDRLLERLYRADSEWIVKGAAALLARDLSVRATVDIDIYRGTASQDAEADLRAASSTDIGDWFRFEVGPHQPASDSDNAVRLQVTAYVGGAQWVEFHVDLVGADLRMTGEPERVPPLAALGMPGLEQRGYLAYPLEDHVADKIAAMFEYHGIQNNPSTRYKDLVDLVAVISGASVAATAQMHALRSEARRRGIELPRRFIVPDRDLWEPGYAKEAAQSLLTRARTLDEALAFVRPFIDPLLEGSATGRWDRERGGWDGVSSSGPETSST